MDKDELRDYLLKEAEIDGITCSSFSWKDAATPDSLILYFKGVGGRGSALISGLIALESKVFL